MPILVNGVDIDNVSLTTAPGWSIKGRIVTETGEVPALARDRVRIMARLVNGDLDPRMPGNNPDNGRVKDDWTFAFTGSFGPSRIRLTLPDGWMLSDYVQDGMWNDPEYLDSIRRYAQRFMLGESETRTVSLKLTAVDAP